MMPQTQQVDAIAVIDALAAEIAALTRRAVIAEQRAIDLEKRLQVTTEKKESKGASRQGLTGLGGRLGPRRTWPTVNQKAALGTRRPPGGGTVPPPETRPAPPWPPGHSPLV